MKKPTYLHYIYYHCVKKKDPTCKEKSVEELYINNRLASYFKEHLKISPALHEWCIANLETLEAGDMQNNSEKKVSLESTLMKKKNEFNGLVSMRARGLITDEEFVEMKTTQQAEIKTLEQSLKKSGSKTEKQEKIAKAKRAFTLALGIEDVFKKGTVQEKKEVLSELGSNLTIKDKKVSIINAEIYEKIINGLLAAKKENPRFEPEFCQDTSGQNSDFMAVRPALLPVVRDVSIYFKEHKVYIFSPDSIV